MKQELKELERLCLEEPNEAYKQNKKVAIKHTYVIEEVLILGEYANEDLDKLLEFLLRLGQSKNRLSRYVEEVLQKGVADLVFTINDEEYEEADGVISLEEIVIEETIIATSLYVSKKLYDYAIEVLSFEVEKNKYCDRRRGNGLRILGDLIEYYEISKILDIFEQSITTERDDELFFALNGIERYIMLYPEKKMSKSLINKVTKIYEESENSMITRMCENIID